MIIIGIDPGYATAGICLLRDEPRNGLACYGQSTDAARPIPHRVDAVTDWLCSTIYATANAHRSGSCVLALEAQHGAAFGASKNHDSAASVVWVREVVGGIRRECFRLGVPVRLIEPAAWRAALGLPRNATKKQAWQQLVRLYPDMAKFGTNEHKRDSLLIANAGARNVYLWLAEYRRNAA